MKKFVFIFAVLLVRLERVQAQNPYSVLGIEEQVLHYDDAHKEGFMNDTLKSIGYVLYSTKKGVLEIYDLSDSLIASRKINPSKVAKWLSIDPLAKEYSGLSPYTYVANNPIIAIDPDGRRILFVNGHYQDNWVGRHVVGSSKPKEAYWGSGFAAAAQNFFKDYSAVSANNFIDGASSWGGDMSGEDRYNAGYEYAKGNLKVLTANMAEGETFKMVTHSEGAAYGAGVAQYLIAQGFKVETVIHLSADEGDEFKTPSAPTTYQLGYDGDWVTGNKPISGVDKSGLVNSGLGWKYVHGSTRNARVFDQVSDLQTVKLEDNIGNAKSPTWKSQTPESTPNKTDFTKINGVEIKKQNGTSKL